MEHSRQQSRQHIALVTGDKAKPRHVSFDVKSLARLPVPPMRVNSDGKEVVNQVTYWDATTKGFGLRISSAGTKTWIWMGRVPRHGRKKVVRYHLGDYAEHANEPGLTLAAAREKAHEYQAAAVRSLDPNLSVRQHKAAALTASAHTFAAVAADFLATHRPKNKKALRPGTLRRYRGLLQGPDFAQWADVPITAITRKDVLAALHRIQQRGAAVTANRALSVVRKMFKWSIQRGILETAPTDHIEPPSPEVPRARHLFGNKQHNRPSELGLLWRACTAVGPFGAIPQLLMLTGQRLDEVAGMRADELLEMNGRDPRWLIPGTRTKNGKNHLVPLTPLTVKTIRGIGSRPHSPYIFSGTGTTPFSGFSHLKKRIDNTIAELKQADPKRYQRHFAEPWTFHDLRRTFKTGLQELGIGSDVRDALTNHAAQGIAAHYEHAELYRQKREAMKLWERHVTACSETEAKRSS